LNKSRLIPLILGFGFHGRALPDIDFDRNNYWGWSERLFPELSKWPMQEKQKISVDVL
jgi:hypothetical protein